MRVPVVVNKVRHVVRLGNVTEEAAGFGSERECLIHGVGVCRLHTIWYGRVLIRLVTALHKKTKKGG